MSQEEVWEEDRSLAAWPEHWGQVGSESSGPVGQDRAPAQGQAKHLGEGPGGDSSGNMGELPKEVDKAADTGKPGPAPADPRDCLSQQSPHTGLQLGLGDGQDRLIVLSFFKKQQSQGCFLKYLDTYMLEAMLQDLSSSLKAVWQESPPYAADKVLDRVLQASEPESLSMAEKMLHTLMMEDQAWGLKVSNMLEESVVLDNIQDPDLLCRVQAPG